MFECADMHVMLWSDSYTQAKVAEQEKEWKDKEEEEAKKQKKIDDEVKKVMAEKES